MKILSGTDFVDETIQRKLFSIWRLQDALTRSERSLVDKAYTAPTFVELHELLDLMERIHGL